LRKSYSHCRLLIVVKLRTGEPRPYNIMISTTRIIHCTNTNCTHPVNPVENRVCANCQTPLSFRYLWAIGTSVPKIGLSEVVADRYEVIAPQIWLDTKPGQLPELPEQLPADIIPYLRLCGLVSHIPQVYGYINSHLEGAEKILLLENVPIDNNGICPSISDAWEQATTVRQVNWLWQILQLWQPLSELGVARSLLLPDNLRVQGGCVRLLELVSTLPVEALQGTSLQQLAQCWQPWVESEHTAITEHLQNIVRQMQSPEAKFADISKQLNLLLLATAAELPLSLKVSGATDAGAETLQNEDSCFPTNNDTIDDPLLSRVSIVCDGIGGHEGGEVASQLAVQSIKLQVRALFAEVSQQSEPVAPDLLQQQIEASLRVVNNLICSSNNQQHREGTQRMGTTLVMAVQIPQPIQTIMGWDAENSHELYVANVGDSRAYWITRDYCQLLTVDDDIVARELRLGRNFYRQALQRPDAFALTQALGTKEGENLRPVVQRLIIDDDGILLLCSDGLSDNNLVEYTWRDFVVPVLNGAMTLDEAVHSWIALANQLNGHDDTSIVLTHCRVTPEYIVAKQPSEALIDMFETHIEPEVELEAEIKLDDESEFAESSQALLDLELPNEAPVTPIPVAVAAKKKPLPLLLSGLLLLVLASTSIGLFAWWKYNPRSFGQGCRQLPVSVQRICPRSN
jgi:protein phosphatase